METIEALPLPLPGGGDPLPDKVGRLPRALPPQVLEGHVVHLDEQVDAVEKGPRDPPGVALDLAGGAGAGPGP